MTELRTVEARKAEVLAALERQGDLWLATGDSAGRPHLIAVSAWWDGTDLVVATTAGSRTAANLAAGRNARLAAGATNDVVMIDARVVESTPATQAAEVADGFAIAVGWIRATSATAGTSTGCARRAYRPIEATTSSKVGM